MPFPIQPNGGAITNDTLNVLRQLSYSLPFPSGGNYWFVDPQSGSDQGNNGQNPTSAFQSLPFALSMATANQNDVIFLLAKSNDANITTARANSTLTWNKGLTHLVGVNDGPMISQRSRVAFTSTYANASNLMTVSASGCFIANIQMFAGVSSALPTGCLQVTGQRNKFFNVHAAGMGAAANDISGAYSLYLNAAAENVFEECYIGVDTVTLGAQANSQIRCASQATRNMFKRCKIVTYTNHATNNNFLRAPTGSLDRWLMFEDCQFVNPVDAGATALTQAFIVAADAGGSVLLVGANTGVVGATDWNSTDSGNVRAINGTVTAGTFGLGVAVTR